MCDMNLSAEGFGQLFEHSPQAMLLEDGKGMIVEVNAAACRLYGRERSDLIQRHAAEILPPRMRGDHSSGAAVRESLLEKNGRNVPVQVLTVPSNLEGEQGHLTTVWTMPQAVDTSQRHVVESSQAMTGVQDAMELMAGRLAHRFNNILTTFSGYGSLVEKDLEQGIVRASHVRKIIEAAEEAQNVTGDLLRLSRRQPSATLAPLDLNAFITGYIGEMRERTGEQRNITLDLKDSPLKIEGNREALDGIFARIAQNLADYLPVRSEITISTCVSDGNAIVLVRDDGPGISGEVLERVFDLFYTTSNDPGSLGLGLPVIRGLVRSLLGNVAIRPLRGGGTELCMTFPSKSHSGPPKDAAVAAPKETQIKFRQTEFFSSILNSETEEPKMIAEPQPTPASNSSQKNPMPKGDETILVVEDEPMVRELVTRSLTYLGYKVIKADDGQAGYELALSEKESIDLIFSDIVMPRVSGPEMVHRLQDQGVNLRVLFTTGFTENRRILENGEIKEGVNLLPKPYTTRVLAERIRQALDGE